MKLTTYFFLILLCVLPARSYARVKACDLWQDLPNKRYNEVLHYKNELFKKISNTRIFYKVSDELLSKASDESYRTKKGFLAEWAAYSQVSPSKQSNIILEWRRQFLLGVLLPSYLELNKAQQNILNNAFIDLHNFTFPQETKKSYEKILNQAKALSYSLIDSQKFSKNIAMILKGNIARIKINWVDSIKDTQIMEDPSKYFDIDIQLNPKHHVLTIGQLASQHSDGDTILSIMLQQIALSFSPCRWSILYKDKKFPYEKIVSCLQKPNSVYAKKRDDSKIEDFFKEKKITKIQKEALIKYPSCNTENYPIKGMQHDQTNIAFSDWFSAEAMAQFKKLSPKFREDLCSIGAHTTLQSYPPNFERLVRIYLSNKKIRDMLNIQTSKDIIHCKL